MKSIALLLALLGASAAQAEPIAEVLVRRNLFGSGVQDGPVEGFVNAMPTSDDGIFQVPSYMPGHPTAGTIYPRVVAVECNQEGARLICDGYLWHPDLGRAEYLLIRPIPKQRPPVAIAPPVVNPDPAPVLPPTEVPTPEPVIIFVPYSVPAEPEPSLLDFETSAGGSDTIVPTPVLKKKPPKRRKVPSCTPDGKVRWTEGKK